jgi:hypothetical protein
VKLQTAQICVELCQTYTIQAKLTQISSNSHKIIITEETHIIYMGLIGWFTQSLSIPDKTAEKHIAKFEQNGLINQFAHDKYKKV